MFFFFSCIIIAHSKAFFKRQSTERSDYVSEIENRAREARNSYRRAWAKANRDKVKAQQQRYWARRAEREAAAQAAQGAAQAGQEKGGGADAGES